MSDTFPPGRQPPTTPYHPTVASSPGKPTTSRQPKKISSRNVRNELAELNFLFSSLFCLFGFYFHDATRRLHFLRLRLRRERCAVTADTIVNQLTSINVLLLLLLLLRFRLLVHRRTSSCKDITTNSAI